MPAPDGFAPARSLRGCRRSRLSKDEQQDIISKIGENRVAKYHTIPASGGWRKNDITRRGTALQVVYYDPGDDFAILLGRLVDKSKRADLSRDEIRELYDIAKTYKAFLKDKRETKKNQRKPR